MPATTRVPNGDGTTLGLDIYPTTPTTHFDKVDEGVPGDDLGTQCTTISSSTKADFLNIQDMPSDFDTAIDLTVNMRTEISGVVDDTVDVRGTVFEATETSAIATSESVAGNHSWFTTNGTARSNTQNKATWDTHKVRLQARRSNSGMPDSVVMRFTAIEVVINYNVTGPGGQPTMQRTQGIPTGPGSRDRPRGWN